MVRSVNQEENSMAKRLPNTAFSKGKVESIRYDWDSILFNSNKKGKPIYVIIFKRVFISKIINLLAI